jgi:hypothetical protein
MMGLGLPIILDSIENVQHDPLSLYIKLKGPSNAKLDFYSPWYGLFSRPLGLHGHGPWSVCKATRVHMDLLMVSHEGKMEHVNAKTSMVKFGACIFKYTFLNIHSNI